MTYQAKPNSWVYHDPKETTQLNYALQIDPAPFTVSIPQENPVTGSLEFVVTNGTSAGIAVTSITFPLVIGTGSDCMTTTTAGIDTSVSDTVNWTLTGPPTPVTNGTADYILEPAVQGYELPAGASVVVQIFGFQTIQTPGNSLIQVKEIIGSLAPAYCNFTVTTFPTGFYFRSLSATVLSGLSLVPVAQIATGSRVVLTWNSSVVDLSAFTIYYSDQNNGQQTARPSDVGEWLSPPLSCDTVFTVVVTISAEGGQPLTASMTTSVSVLNPSLVAASINTGTAIVANDLTVSGTLNGNGMTSTGFTITGTGTLSTYGATVTDSLSAGSLGVTNNINAGSATVTGLLNSGTATVTGLLTAGSATITDALGASTLNTNELNVYDIINSTGGANISGTLNLCGKSDYSMGTVGIGGSVPTNAMLTVTNTQNAGYGVSINAPYLATNSGNWALYVVGGAFSPYAAWFRPSDIDLKKDVSSYQDGLAEILKINPIKFHYKEESGLGSSYEHIGVSAQELQGVAPYMVGKGKVSPTATEEYLHMDTGPLTYMLINAVKELKAELDLLKAEKEQQKKK